MTTEAATIPTYTLKAVVQNYYDWQEQRKRVAGRIRMAVAKEAYLTAQDVKLYDSQISDLEALEKAAEKRVAFVVKEHVMWPWLNNVRGCGVMMAAAMISQFDINRAPRPSNFWSFAGLGVKPDGRAPRREAGLIQADGRKGLPYNGWLRTKLVGVLGPGFLRANNEEYRAIYDGYRHRLESAGCCSLPVAEHSKSKSSIAEWFPSGSKAGAKPGDFCTKGHMHNKAVRYIVKMFLLALWEEWRRVENLPIVAPYAEAKLGMKHGE